ncbi:MAG TPA: alpha/beta hydrolase [Polyangiaceae bacterium]|nr:alpha/beta hydrolase [Polyangiaceae bacterium]
MFFRALPILLLASCGSSPQPLSHPQAPDALGVGDHAVPVDGVTLAYHVAGSGPRCLVVPGGPGLTWTYARMPSLEKRLTLVYLEPIGSGASGRLPPDQKYSLQRYADQLEAFRVAVGLDRMCLVGHSHGGMIALRYAAQHSERVSALVAYDAPDRTDKDFGDAIFANAKKWFEGKPWYQGAIDAFSGPDSKTDAEGTAVWAKILPLYFYDYDSNAAAYDAAGKVAYSVAPDTQAAKTGHPLDMRTEFPGIQAPTLVIVGARDFIASEPFAREIASGIRGAQLVVLEKSGHMGHVEEPERFAAVVGDFVLAHAK